MLDRYDRVCCSDNFNHCSDNFNHKKVIIRGYGPEFSCVRVILFLILVFNWVLEYPSFNGRPWAIAYLHSPIAACDYKLDRIQLNFVKMKQEPQGYKITSNKLEFVRNTLKIMWRFLQENLDDYRRKILTIFQWKVDYVLQKNFMIFAEKFNWRKILCFLQKKWWFL